MQLASCPVGRPSAPDDDVEMRNAACAVLLLSLAPLAAAAAAAAAVGAAVCGALLAAPGGVSAGAGFPTPPGYAELPPASECKIGCETLTMSGNELLRNWMKRTEGGKKWFHTGNPLRKFAFEMGICHEGISSVEPRDGDKNKAEAFKVAKHVLKHLAELEDKVEAKNAAETGIPASEASRADKHARLYEAYLKEEPLQYLGLDLKLDTGELHGPFWADGSPDKLKALQVNFYHQITGLLRWPHYDWRPTPKIDKDSAREEQERTCKVDTQEVYVINLKSRKDRRAAVVREMPPGVRYSFIDAVDGRAMRDEELRPFPGFKLEPNNPWLGLVPGLLMQNIGAPNPYFENYWTLDVLGVDVGLLMSIKNAFERALDEGLETILLLEDDHVVKSVTYFPNPYCFFLKEVEALQASGLDWDYVQVESYNWFGDDAAATPEGLSPWLVPLSTAHNTHAVLWHARGMRKLLSSGVLDRCQMVIDEFTSYMTNPGRYTRKDYHACFGEGGGPPDRMFALRWRGPRFIEDLPEQEDSTFDSAGVEGRKNNEL